MGKNKLRKFADMETMERVVQPAQDEILVNDYSLKGKWRKEFFKNDNPIILELGCGKGEYAVQMGEKYPDKNFLGVDIKGARIWFGANEVREKNLPNVGFIRTKVEFISKFFDPNEIDEIWLTFSDPQRKKPNKRLTGKRYIDMYRGFLKPDGVVHLKTDSDVLFESTLEQIEEHNYTCLQSSWDLYAELIQDLDQETQEILEIKTHYEDLFSKKGFSIKYCKFTIN